MLKKFVFILLACGIALSLSACDLSFTCDLCGEEKSGISHKSDFLGEEVVLCDECYSEIKEFVEE